MGDWEWSELGLGGDWLERLEAEAAGSREAELRRATYSGIPFGDEQFMAEMEKRFQRRLRPMPPGPAPKARSAAVGTGSGS